MARIVIKKGVPHIQFFNYQEMLDVAKIADQIRHTKPTVEQFHTALKNAGLLNG